MSTDIHIIILVGYSGSGKSLLRNYLNTIYNIPYVSTGDIVRDEAIKRGYSNSFKDIEKIAKLLDIETGYKFILLAFPYINHFSDLNDTIVVDCARTIQDIDLLNNEYSKSIVVAIKCPPKIRFNNLLSRNRKDIPQTYEDFVELTKREKKEGVEKLINKSNVIIQNSNNIEFFYNQIDNFILEFNYINASTLPMPHEPKLQPKLCQRASKPNTKSKIVY